MAKTADLRRSGFWTTVVLYGLALAGLVFFLKYIEYRFWVRDLRMEVYVGVVAVLFTALGIWVGKKLLEGRQVVAPLTAPPSPTAPPPGPNQAAIADLGISGRELEVLGLMAKGYSNQEIADQLFISLPTVKSHSSNLFVKLDVGRRTQAVHKAKELGILP
ncbi:MAG: DNA-binding response regulator [Flavobacteriales bacterium]|nr:DNA-binding response regulator [Flavobacteriales bacterium]